jgi:hypothetical protein
METETVAALIGGFVGGLLTISGNLIHEWWRDRRRSEQLAHAIAGEARALVHIIERRRYLEIIKDYAQRARQGEVIAFEGRITRNYFPVIEASLDQIGMLRGEMPLLIPEMLTLAKSVLEDMEAIQAGAWSDRDAQGYAEGYTELGDVLESALRQLGI